MIQHRQVLCKPLQHKCSPCEECNTRDLLMLRKRHHKVNEVRMQCDPSPGRRVAFNSLSKGRRFRQSRQSRLELPGVSDGNQSCCWWYSLTGSQRNQESIVNHWRWKRCDLWKDQASNDGTEYDKQGFNLTVGELGTQHHFPNWLHEPHIEHQDEPIADLQPFVNLRCHHLLPSHPALPFWTLFLDVRLDRLVLNSVNKRLGHRGKSLVL